MCKICELTFFVPIKCFYYWYQVFYRTIDYCLLAIWKDDTNLFAANLPPPSLVFYGISLNIIVCCYEPDLLSRAILLKKPKCGLKEISNVQN